ncbi:MAG: DegT/DnrJ/EryC1/StrS family aminotransferase [Armatimonadetes bacterium]|nr:DegT/DnrJ/EryC1/StrS family aminotransferase [Armatimonadota bacterium]
MKNKIAGFEEKEILTEEPVRPDYLIFGSPRIEEDEIEEVVASLKSGWLGTGPKVAKFQSDFRDYIGCKHAIALNSCTAGLHLSLLVSGVGPGDEVITTPMTFAATANSIIHVGAKPVFVDIELPSMNINPALIESAITERTKAIIPVHFAGRPCDMDKIMKIAKKHGLIVIEDAAHAIEAWYHGQKIGNIGDLTCFSFYVTKNIVTGEGGMVTTNNDEWADAIRIYSLHGLSKDAWKRYSDDGFKHYQVVAPGYKYNMMDIQAAIGFHQLRKIAEYHRRRKEIWETYNREFSSLPMDLPPPEERDTVHARHLYTPLLRIDEIDISRDEFQQRLHKMNIGTGIHFVSLHLHPYYAETFGYRPEDFPNALEVSRRTISFPLSAKLTEEDVNTVILAVRRAFQA